MADYGVGYFFSINSGSGDAFEKVGKAIRAYIGNKLQRPALPPVAALPANAADYSGFYEPDSPRVELFHFLGRLLGLCRVHFQDGKLIISSLGRNEIFLPVTGTQFRHVPKEDAPDPVPTLELLSVNPEGRFIQADETTLKEIPAWMAFGEILATAFVALSIVSIVVYAPFWILAGISKRRRRPAERALRLWPLLAVLSLVAIVGLVILCGDDFIGRLGNLSVWSATLWALTLVFAVTSIASAFYSWQSPAPGVRRWVRRFSMVASVALLLATVYLTYWGFIGVRTWA